MTDLNTLESDEELRMRARAQAQAELEAQQQANSIPLTPGEEFTGHVADLGNKMTLGGLKYPVAAITGGIDSVKNLWSGQNANWGENISGRLDQVNDLTKRFQEQHPVAAGFDTGIGVAAVPVPTRFISAEKGFLPAASNVVKQASVGAGYGWATGSRTR